MNTNTNQINFLKKNSIKLRIKVLEAVYKAGKGHIGGAYSMIDILTVLFYGGFLKHDPKNPNWKERDIFLLSKGHAGIGLYCILSDRGFFEEKHLFELNNGGLLGEHPDANIPGIEVVGGSLGHGLGIACGMAKADKLNLNPRKYFVLMGDGELYEGSVWEAILFTCYHNLSNLILIIDRNRYIATAGTEEVNSLSSISDKMHSFGFNVIEIDAHNIEEIYSNLTAINDFKSKKPTVLIANSVKGKGVSFMENEVSWHHGGIREDTYKKAKMELETTLGD